MASEEVPSIQVVNFSGFFSRAMKLYSLGDIPLPRPVDMLSILYFVLFAAIFDGPVYLLFHVLPTNPYIALYMIGVPLFLTVTASKPIWGGRKLFGWLKVTATYLTEPRAWADSKASKRPYNIRFDWGDFWISRRRELFLLSVMREATRRGKDVDLNQVDVQFRRGNKDKLLKREAAERAKREKFEAKANKKLEKINKRGKRRGRK